MSEFFFSDLIHEYFEQFDELFVDFAFWEEDRVGLEEFDQIFKEVEEVNVEDLGEAFIHITFVLLFVDVELELLLEREHV